VVFYLILWGSRELVEKDDAAINHFAPIRRISSCYLAAASISKKAIHSIIHLILKGGPEMIYLCGFS